VRCERRMSGVTPGGAGISLTGGTGIPLTGFGFLRFGFGGSCGIEIAWPGVSKI